jgi:HEAT repeat protein
MFLFPPTVKKVQQWASKGKYDALIQLLEMKKASLETRSEAVALLGKGKVSEAIPVLISLTGETSLRKQLIECFGNIPDRQIYETLTVLLKQDQENSTEIIRSLGKIRFAEAIPLLLKRIEKPKEQDAIVKAIREIAGKRKHFDVVLEAFTSNRSTDYLVLLCKILAGNEDPDVQKKLSEYIFASDPKLRKAVGEAKKTKSDKQWPDWLLGDEDDFKRLADSGNYYAYELLMEQYLKGNKILDQFPNEFVYRVMYSTIADLKDRAFQFMKDNKYEKAIPELSKYITNYDGQIRIKVSELLLSLGVTKYKELIIGDEHDFIRLFQYDPSEGAEMIRDMLTHTFGVSSENMQMLKKIVTELGKINNDKALEVLLYCAQHSALSKECFDAISKTGNQKVLDYLNHLLVSPVKDERLKAAKKLEEFGDQRWINLVKGDDGDKERLCLAGNQLAINSEIQALGFSKMFREPSAHILLKVLKNNPESVLNWHEVQKKLQTPHKDVHEDTHCDVERTSDCHSDNDGSSVHEDTGFNLSFTSEQLRFFNDVEYKAKRENKSISEKYIIGQLKDGKSTVMDAVFEDAMQFSSPAMMETMSGLLDNTNPFASKALEYLIQHREAALPYFVHALLRYRSDIVINEVVACGEQAFDLLISTLSEVKQYGYIIEALGMVGDKRAVDKIIPFIVSDNANIRMASAEALTKLGEPFWKEVIKNDDRDFERIAALADVRLLFWYKTAFSDTKFEYLKVPLAKTLIKLGEKETAAGIRVLLISPIHSITEIAGVLSMIDDTNWEKIILGNEDDFARLVKTGSKDAVKILLVLLRAADRKTRKHAAESLIEMAKANYSLVQDEWKTISATLKQKHTDNTSHVDHWAQTRSGDCHSDFDSHADVGMGLTIPPEIEFPEHGK